MRSPRRALFVIYSNPAGYPPVERSAAIFRDRGFEVRILGARGLGTDVFDAHRLRDIDVRLVPRGGTGFVQKLQYAWFLVRGIAELLLWRPTWVHASDPFATPVALLASMLGFRVIYHEHDAPSPSPGSMFLRLLLASRRQASRRATIVVTPNAERSLALGAVAGGREVLTIWNCPSRSEIRNGPIARGDGPLRLVYQGSLVPARLPLTVLEAMARCSGAVVLQLMGVETKGAEGYLGQLLRRASELNLADRVVAIPPLPRERMLDQTATGSLGLALMPMESHDENERTMAGASNKAFEYLACGLPILISELPDWRAIFPARGVAWSCDPGSVDSIHAVLERAIADRAALSRMGTTGRSVVESEWNYEAVIQPLLERVAANAEAPAQPAAGAAQPIP